MSAYYNENDPRAAAWLRELIRRGHVADGIVDDRSIADVEAKDLAGFTQAHFFAGIGGWSHALRLAGWFDDRPVWTGSCPCQPFSVAGQQKGTDDARHLWPQWFRLIRECRPATVFGEQVASAIRHGWLDLVFDELESLGYACGSAQLPAAGVGAPHKRDRVWFVGHADFAGLEGRRESGGGRTDERPSRQEGMASELADAESPDWWTELQAYAEAHGREGLGGGGNTGRMANTNPSERRPDVAGGNIIDGGSTRRNEGDGESGTSRALGLANTERRPTERPGCELGSAPDGLLGVEEERQRLRLDARDGGDANFWSAAEWIYCRDDKWRPVEPGSFPLGDGLPARMGRLRGYGNAIVPQVAAAFIGAFAGESR